MSALDLHKIPAFSVFNEENIQSYVIGKQNFKRGCALVACGDVAGVNLASRDDDADFVVVVHAEKAANKHYRVLVKLTNGSVCGAEARCPCDARVHTHHRCKHCAAAMLTLLALTRYTSNALQPRWGRRPKTLKYFSDPTDIEGRALVRYDMDWEGVLRRARAPPERHNSACANVMLSLSNSAQ